MIVDANCVVVCWITLVKMIVEPLAVVVISKVEAGKVEAAKVVVSPRVVVIKIDPIGSVRLGDLPGAVVVTA